MSPLLLPLFIIAINIGTPEECSMAEAIEYESQGWDVYECDGDKAWAPDANWLSFPRIPDQEGMEVLR